MTTLTNPPEAFLLLSLSDASIRTSITTQSGILNLECVTITNPHGNSTPPDRDVYLVLRLNDFEMPIDPARVIHISLARSGQRTYTFDGTEDDPSDLVITLQSAKPGTIFEEDIATFEVILAQYADLRRPDTLATAGASPYSDYPGTQGDLRGHLVLLNEDNGEVVGEVDGSKFNIREDPALHERGQENVPVIIEVPEGEDLGALEMFARAVPPHEQDWMTKSATVIRCVTLPFHIRPYHTFWLTGPIVF